MEPRAAMQIELPSMIAVAARLAQVLAEEVDCLDQMRIRDIEPLQEEKTRLTKALDVMKRELDRNPQLAENFVEEEKETFRQVAAVVGHVMQTNFRKLLVAKEINLRVVRAISDVAKDAAKQPGYSRFGTMRSAGETLPSVTLNQKV